MPLTEDIEAGNINIALAHCLKKNEADPWLVSCLRQDVKKTAFQFLTESSIDILSLDTEVPNPSGLCFPTIYPSGKTGLVDIKCGLDTRREHPMPTSISDHERCVSKIFKLLEKLFWEKNPLAVFSPSNIYTFFSNYRGSFQKEIKGESFALALALEIFSTCTRQELSSCVAATGRVDEEGRVLMVDDVEKKVQLILAERPFVKIILVPSGFQNTDPKVIPISNFSEAIEIVFGSLSYSLRKELDNFPPEVFLKHANEHLQKGERAACVAKSKQLISYTKALNTAQSQTLRLQAMMLLAHAQHDTPEKSFQTYTEALGLYEKLKSKGWCNDPVIGLKLYNGAAEPAKDLYQFDQALKLAQKSLQMSEVIRDLTGNRYDWMAAQAHIAQILISMNEPDRARAYLKNAMDCAHDLKDEDSMLRYHCNELRLEMQAGNIEKAHQLYLQQRAKGVTPHQYLLLEWVRLGYEGAKKELSWAKGEGFKKGMSDWSKSQSSEEWLDILKKHFFAAWQCWTGDAEGFSLLELQYDKMNRRLKETSDTTLTGYCIMIALRLSECFEGNDVKDKSQLWAQKARNIILTFGPVKKFKKLSRELILRNIFI